MPNIKTMALCHHGIKGMHWGVKNGPPYPLNPSGGFAKPSGALFVSGSSKTQDKDSEYYRKSLSRYVKRQLDRAMSDGKKIIVGDAPGVDRQVQDYLASKGYENVDVYTPTRGSRYRASESFRVKHIKSDAPEGSKEWLAKKDIAMARDASEGLAVILEDGASATRRNIDRLIQQNKNVKVYELSKSDPKLDHYVKDTLQFSSRTAAVSDIMANMHKEVTYSSYDKLKSADSVRESRSGDCHSQVQYEYSELKKLGVPSKAIFLMEYDGKNNSGGSTHSAIFYTDAGKTIWLENAWGDNRGMHAYSSKEAMLRDIKRKFKASGDSANFPNIVVSEYDPSNHSPGETLQEFVDICLR